MTDHKAKALERLSIGADFTDPRNPPNASGQEALVHATLYLAEQQRIANLLAFAQFDHNGRAGQRIYTTIDFAEQLRTEAGRALGLDE